MNMKLYSPRNVSGGTIDGAVIGGTTPAAGTFTTFEATGHKIITANSISYNVLNAVQQDSVTDATTNGTTTISKAGENFNATCIVGDTVLIWGGTTTADYGVYSIKTVTSDTALVLDRACSGSVADMDFYVFRGGTITTGSSTYVGPSLIKTVNEPGLGNRLTFGLDETARTMVICDKGDVDVDYGLSPINTSPTLVIAGPTTDWAIKLGSNVLFAKSGFQIRSGYGNLSFMLEQDLAAGNAHNLNSLANIELTDTDGEQSMVYIEPKINQSGTAAYNGLKINVTETALGSGATGDGNNLLNLQVASVTKAKISNLGNMSLLGLPAAAHADNAAAKTAGLVDGDLYYTAGVVKVVYTP